ncbi:MAG: hypothetical protein KGI58_02670 [Patescibacteria group bacterium]|nr:hypothetical protein [Patescibacteria group bacterium]
MDQQGIVQPLISKPLFQPTYINIDYVFNKIYTAIKPIVDFFASSHTWVVLGIISSFISIICIAIIIFSLVRMREIQLEEKREIDHEIHEALLLDKQKERNQNPRWHYVLTLIESSNESDWRVAIIEADSMLEELLRNKGFTGNTTSELLESARSNGYQTIQNAWDAHLVRNQIAHAGAEFSLTQLEGRRVIKLFQSFFEELGVI